MNNPLRIVIVGTGVISETHLRAIQESEEATLAGWVGSSAEKARAQAEKFGGTAFASISEAVASPEVDAAIVGTPSGCHGEVSLPFLKAGKPVLCEKPIEITTARVNEMISAAAASGTVLAGLFPMREGFGARKIKEALEAGRFGRLTMLAARVKWWRDQSYYDDSNWKGTWKLDGGGALINQGIHAVDLLYYFGGRPSVVQALAGETCHPGVEVEDSIVASLRYPNGAVGTIEASTACYPGLNLRLEVSGDAGTAVIENDQILVWDFRDKQPSDGDVLNRESKIRGGSNNPKVASAEGHRIQLDAFCRAVRTKAKPMLSGEEAAGAVEIVERVYQSARAAKTLPEPRDAGSTG